MASKTRGLDLRAQDALLVEGRKKGAVFQVVGCELITRDGNRLSGGTPLAGVVTGLSGRELILRYVRVPQVPDWQLAKLMEFEVDEISGQAGGSLSADYNLLPIANEMTGEDTVLLALAKDSHLAEQARAVESRKGSVEAYVPNAIALYNAFLTLGPVSADDVTLVAWIGETAIDIALLQGANLLFARNVSGGLAVLDAAIGQTFNVRENRAQKIRDELLDLDPRSRGRYASSQEEKATHSVQGVAGQLQAALRSTLAFCQTQTGVENLTLARCHLCGPGARIRGMAAFFADGLRCPVDIFDPTESLDTSSLDAGAAQVLSDQGPEAALAIGLALTPLFEELYSIEILPEAVKKRRRFQTRTVFNIAAAALAVLFLGWRWFDGKRAYDDAERAAAKIESQVKVHKSVEAETTSYVEKNDERSKVLDELRSRSVPLYGTLATLRVLREILPSDLWVSKLESKIAVPTWVKPTGDVAERRRTKVPARPFLLVQGGGKSISGKLLTETFRELKNELDKRGIPYREPMVNESGGDFVFSFKVDWLDVTPPAAEDGQD
ncbi:MAG: pilus assembly protein PilM [Planctomycetes bacterium]|nr:pilus assembly protein PilM [Planctomycetota bacterium]